MSSSLAEPQQPAAAPLAVAVVEREVTQAKLDRRSQAAGVHRASQSFCTAERIEQAADRFGPRTALVYAGRRWTYAEFDAEINRVAHAARAAGVVAGDVVALCLENRPGFFFVWFGLAKLGATVAFLNTNVNGRVLAHALAATGAKRAVVGEECLANFAAPEVQGTAELWLWPDAERPATPELKSLTSFDLGAAAAAAPATRPDAAWRAGTVGGAPLVYIFTSGTTGLPKAAVISHARWLITGDVMQVTMGVTPDDVFYCFLPLYHGAASLSATATALAAGASLVVRRKFSKREFWPDVRSHGITICQYVGEICRFLLTEPEAPGEADNSLRAMVGAGLTVEVWEKFVRRFGALDIYEGWGATESNTNTINLDNRVGSCGRVPDWAKTNLRIVRYDVEADAHPRDAEGHYIACQPGEPGEAIGRIHNYPDIVGGRFEGYTSAEATERKILRNVFEPGDAWWSSGDLLRYDEDGYCWFIDRIGDTYRWKSENVSTMEVADALAETPGVETVTVYGVLVPGHEGRAGMASVVMQADCDFDPAAFYSVAAERLPRYAQPVFVRVSAAADMTSTFKLRKVDLQREGYDRNQVSDPLYVRDDAARRYVELTPESLQRAV